MITSRQEICSPIGSFKKGFETVLKEAGIELDRYGEKRTIYSLRHTYATCPTSAPMGQFRVIA